MQQPTIKIAVEVLDEAVTFGRWVDALDLGNDTYEILRPTDYDPEDENWAFKPGAIVRCAMTDAFSEKPVFAAVEQVGFEAL